MLRELRILDSYNEPFREFINKGYFKTVVNSHNSYYGPTASNSFRVSKAGIRFIISLIDDKDLHNEYKAKACKSKYGDMI